MRHHDVTLLPESTFPRDAWALVETAFTREAIGLTESLFSIGNGFIGFRAVPEEGTPYVERGAFINGLHEQWPIRHAEAAFGFAELGQTIIPAPDARRVHLYVDDEPLDLRSADLQHFERRLDFRTGQLTRTLDWRLPSGCVVRVMSASLVSLVQRHVVATRYGVGVVEGQAHIVISSQLQNVEEIRDHEGDPRRARGFDHQVLISEGQETTDTRAILRYHVAQSGMTLGCGIDHVVTGTGIAETSCTADAGRGKLVVVADLREGQRLNVDKFATYHTSAVNHDGHPTMTRRLADRCGRTLDRAVRSGWAALAAEQADHLADVWHRADVEVEADDPAVPQAIRWGIFQLVQASARADSRGIPAKGLSGSAYEGHYFWDTEIYVLPFLSYTSPQVARNLLRFRHGMLGHARHRATQVNQEGALYPWRTITGDEASAFFEAGTAQYHINADIAHAVTSYVTRTGDEDFMADWGGEILIETARLWADLGFFRRHSGAPDTFHIHGVTGPDEYTTVVDDNAYTNLMAQANLTAAAEAVAWLASAHPEAHDALVRRTELTADEPEAWLRAASGMHLPHDPQLNITPQDEHFLHLQRWPFERVPDEDYPLLLHFHPLVIYRYQVIKQADVVLAMFLQDRAFDADLQRRNFNYYDPLTTGDSSLSTAVQSLVAARIGLAATAEEYFRYGAFMDLANVAGNAEHGVHVAAAGGVWLSAVYGFGGLVDTGEHLAFSPRLPESWQRLSYTLQLRGQRLRVEVTVAAIAFELGDGDPLEVVVEGESVLLAPGEITTVPR